MFAVLLALLSSMAFGLSQIWVRKNIEKSNPLYVSLTVTIMGNLILWPLALYYTGQSYMKTGQYEEAIERLNDAAGLFEKLNDTKGLCNAFLDLSACYYHIEEIENSSNCMHRAGKLAEEIKDKELQEKVREFSKKVAPRIG